MNLDARAWVLFFSMAAAGATPAVASAACPEQLQFLGAKCAQWQAQVLPESLPASRGNATADNEAAALLGMKVFYDGRFSREGSGVACANCHDPEHAFTERKAVSRTLGEIRRNTPDLLNAVWYTRSHFWDGKVDNLWSAPLFAFEQEAEMDSSRLRVVQVLASIYKPRYEAVWGPMPDLGQRLPASGKPGAPQFDGLSAQDRDLVNQVYANVGKALEAYLRKLAAGRAPFDDFMNGSPRSMSAAGQRGMVAFTRHGCDTCHSGPTFTDEGFHDLGIPAKPGQPQDPARAGGAALAGQWQFTSTSRFADSIDHNPNAKVDVAHGDPGGFRTPSLRNVMVTAPYGHDGAFATLEQAIDAHARVLPDQAAPDAQDRQDIIEFLRALTGRPPQRPWNYWPGG